MSTPYGQLFEKNKHWAAATLQVVPAFFRQALKGQAPEYLYIGCSHSRVPAETITGTQRGELFVHHNIANLVVGTE